MKRINIYIPEDTDTIIDNLSELLQVNRSEIFRLAINEFYDSHASELNNFINNIEEITETPDDIFIKECANSVEYFVTNAVTINTLNGKVKYEMYDFQKELLYKFDTYNHLIVNHSRQIGVTTLELAYTLWYALFNTDKNIVLTTPKLLLSQDLLSKLKDMYNSLPDIIKDKIKIDVSNKNHLRFTNNCKILAVSPSSDSVRGCSINLLLIDNAAFISNVNFKDFVASTFPVIATVSNAKIIISSTPNGYNYFFKIWADALTNENTLHAIELPYSLISNRDDEWKQKQIAMIGKPSFMSEYECKFFDRTKANVFA